MNEQDIEQKAAELLIAIGSKPLKNGSLTLHFDGEGLFQTVDVKFSRKVRKAQRTTTAYRPPIGMGGIDQPSSTQVHG